MSSKTRSITNLTLSTSISSFKSLDFLQVNCTFKWKNFENKDASILTKIFFHEGH